MLKKILLVLFLFGQLSWAFNFSIDKPSFHVETASGTSQSFSLTLRNNGDLPLNVKVYVQDWAYAQNKKGKVFLPAGSGKFSCAQWLKFDQVEFKLEPRSKKDFHFKVETPRQAEGGHQAVIFFETQPENRSKGLSYAARLGTIIYQETKDKTLAKLELTDKQAGIKNGKAVFSFTVRNAGNAWNNASAIVSLLRGSEVLEQQTISAVNLLPGDTTGFAGEFTKSGTEILLTVEDHKENLLTERMDLGGAETIAAIEENPAELTITSFKPIYNTATKELNISLTLLASAQKKILPEIKILKIIPDKNIYERLKTLTFSETAMEPAVEQTLSLNWPAGKFLPAGKYLVKVEVPELDSPVTAEQEITVY